MGFAITYVLLVFLQNTDHRFWSNMSPLDSDNVSHMTLSMQQ